MSLVQRTKAAYSAFLDPSMMEKGGISGAGLNSIIPEADRERYALLDLYFSNVVYRELGRVLPYLARYHGFNSTLAFENPAIQAVGFHVAHLFPGRLQAALPLEAQDTGDGDDDNEEAIRTAAYRVMSWSNFAKRKRVFSEWLALYGDVFLKPSFSSDASRVNFQVRHPADVTEYTEDERGHITYARLDVYLSEDEQGPNKTRWWTEEWSKEDGTYRQWYSKGGPKAKIEDLGTPNEEKPLSAFGIDFVPLVRAPFADTGELRSPGVFQKFLEPMDEMNRQATSLRDRYNRYNRADLGVFANEAGRGAVDVRPDPNAPTEPDELNVGGEQLIRFPGLTRAEYLVPNIDYGAGLSQIADSREAIERQMPELRFYRGHDSGDPSAAAMRQHMAPAVSRAQEARGNAEAAILEVMGMCFTIGQSRGIFGTDIGRYQAGDFEGLSFAEREIIPETPGEKRERQESEARLLETYQRAGMLRVGLETLGYSDEESERIASQARQSSTRSRLSALLNEPEGEE